MVSTFFPDVLPSPFMVGAHAQLVVDNGHYEQSVAANPLSIPLAFAKNQAQWDSGILFKAYPGGAAFCSYSNEMACLFCEIAASRREELFASILSGVNIR